MKMLVGFGLLTILIFSTAVMGQGYPALSETSYNYFGAGARAFAMGDAYVGLSNDITSGTWNPAGIWVIESPVVSVSYNIYKPKGEFTDSWATSSTLGSLDSKSIGDFSLATPIRLKGHPWVFNFNYKLNNEFIVETNLFSGRNQELNPDIFATDEGSLRSFNFGFSTRLYKQLSFGFTANIYNGQRVKEQNIQSTGLIIYSEIPYIATTYFQDVIVTDSTSTSGLNFTLGLMNKTDKFAVGLVAHTPFKMRNETDQSTFRVTTEEGLPLIELSDTLYVDDQIAKQDIPLSLTLGFAVFPKENIVLTLDANYQNYSSTNWYYRTSTFYSASGDRTDIFGELPIDWNNIFSFGSGLEYALDTDFGRIPLRAGLRFDQLPQPKSFDFTSVEILEPDEVTGGWFTTREFVTTQVADGRQNSVSFSLGTGIHWSQIEIDFGYRYRTGAKLEVNESTIWYADEDNDGLVDLDPDTGERLGYGTDKEQTYEDKTHEFKVTFIGHF